jgi:hypothetical protein
LGACSESTSGVPKDPTDGGAVTPGDDAAVLPSDAGTTPKDSGSLTKPDGDIATAEVLINEISASDDWVELVNAGTTAVDISGWKLADSEKDGGAPKESDAVVFPSNTVLSPKATLMVLAGDVDAGTPCPGTGSAYCLYAPFGISNKDGETLYLIGKTGVVGSVTYPPSAAQDTETFCRIPHADPTGKFVACAPTPGASNKAK